MDLLKWLLPAVYGSVVGKPVALPQAFRHRKKRGPPCPQLNSPNSEKRRPIDALAVDKDPVGAVEILDPPLPIFPENVGVSAADPAVWNAEGTFRVAAYGKAL